MECLGWILNEISYLWKSWKMTGKRRTWTAMLANSEWWAEKFCANLIETSLRNAAKRKRHVSTTWKAVERLVETWLDTRLAFLASISTTAARLELQQQATNHLRIWFVSKVRIDSSDDWKLQGAKAKAALFQISIQFRTFCRNQRGDPCDFIKNEKAAEISLFADITCNGMPWLNFKWNFVPMKIVKNDWKTTNLNGDASKFRMMGREILRKPDRNEFAQCS